MHLQTQNPANGTERKMEEEGNYLICCFFRLYDRSLLNAVCLIDMIFYLITLSFNLVWVLLEIFGKTEAVGKVNSIAIQIGYAIIMISNVMVLVYAIHFKINYKKYNMMVKNWYFNIYYHMRICLGILGSLLALIIIAYLNFFTSRKNSKENAEHMRFLRISNIFSVVYIIYSAFCLSSSRGFRLSWYGMISKDIDFYFS